MRQGRNQNQDEAAEKTTLIFTVNIFFYLFFINLFILDTYIFIFLCMSSASAKLSHRCRNTDDRLPLSLKTQRCERD